MQLMWPRERIFFTLLSNTKRARSKTVAVCFHLVSSIRKYCVSLKLRINERLTHSRVTNIQILWYMLLRNTVVVMFFNAISMITMRYQGTAILNVWFIWPNCLNYMITYDQLLFGAINDWSILINYIIAPRSLINSMHHPLISNNIDIENFKRKFHSGWTVYY